MSRRETWGRGPDGCGEKLVWEEHEGIWEAASTIWPHLTYRIREEEDEFRLLRPEAMALDGERNDITCFRTLAAAQKVCQHVEDVRTWLEEPEPDEIPDNDYLPETYVPDYEKD